LRSRLTKSIALAAACTLAVPAIVMAASDPVGGGLYKGTFPVSAGPNNLRIHVAKDGTRGNFTLPCAGLKRKRFEISDGHYVVKVVAEGGPNPVFRAKGRFTQGGQMTVGAVKRVGENGAECGPASYQASLVN
jgi:hypothetical protein